MRIEWVPIEEAIDETGQKIMIAVCLVLSIFMIGLVYAVLTGHITPPRDEVTCTKVDAVTTTCVES